MLNNFAKAYKNEVMSPLQIMIMKEVEKQVNQDKYIPDKIVPLWPLNRRFRSTEKKITDPSMKENSGIGNLNQVRNNWNFIVGSPQNKNYRNTSVMNRIIHAPKNAFW